MEIEITEQNFDELLNGGKPLMVDFYADWCGPCRHIMPFVEQIAEAYADKAVVGRSRKHYCGRSSKTTARGCFESNSLSSE